MKICYGIKNSHEPLFFKSFLTYFDKHNLEQHVVARDYIEVVSLLRQLNIPFKVIGRHYGGNKFMKMYGAFANVIKMVLFIPYFDVSISHGNTYLIYASKLRRKKTIAFTDNDLSFNLSTYNRLVDWLFVPSAIPKRILLKRNCKEDKIVFYNGYKEDIYIADYDPDQNFLDIIPFKNFVTLRAESIYAHYIPKNTKSIVPTLFKIFREKNINVLFLPRYNSDMEYAKGFDNVFVPKEPLNGLDVCYYSDAVLTGAGTFAREAAILNTPAVSFFPRTDMLSVDKKMIEEKRMFHSRNPQEIYEYISDKIPKQKSELDLSRSKKVQQEVFETVMKIITK